MEHFDERESFAICCSIVMMELDAISEKLKKVEQQIRQQMQVDEQVSRTDFYTPLMEARCEQPPRKKMRSSE
jgi:hypothetical protein